MWKSFWAVFGWFNVVAPDWVYTLATTVVVIGLAGLVVAAGRRKVQREAWPGLVLAATWVAMMGVALYLWAQVRYPQGRLLLPAAPALALLVGAGWVLPWPERMGRWATAGLAVGLVGLSAWLLPAVILPAYAAPGPSAAVPTSAAVEGAWPPAVPWTADDPVTFDQVLLNFAPDSTLETGQTVVVTIPWQVRETPDQDWSVFLHLMDEDGVVVAQRDSYPGGGAWPTGDWRAGDVVTDTHRLTLPFAAGSPPCEACRLLLGWYDAETGARPAGGGLEGEIELAELNVMPARDGAGHPAFPTPVHFGDDIVLDGYDLHRRDLAPGEKLRVTLYWRALTAPPADYRVSVQLRDGDRVVAQSDAAPADDTRPTSTWAAGEGVADEHVFRVPEMLRREPISSAWLMFEPGGQPLPVQFRDFEAGLGPVQVSEEDG